MSPSNLAFKLKRRTVTVLWEVAVLLLHITSAFPSHHIRRLFLRLFGMRIGKGSSIHMGLRVYRPDGINIGQDSVVGEGCVLDGRGELKIGDHVAIASEVMIYNSQHDIHSSDFRPLVMKTVISDYVFIGPRSIILPGITIGRGAVIAAGAVVTKDVAPYTIAAGVPAVPVGMRSETATRYRVGRAAWFR